MTPSSEAQAQQRAYPRYEYQVHAGTLRLRPMSREERGVTGRRGPPEGCLERLTETKRGKSRQEERAVIRKRPGASRRRVFSVAVDALRAAP